MLPSRRQGPGLQVQGSMAKPKVSLGRSPGCSRFCRAGEMRGGRWVGNGGTGPWALDRGRGLDNEKRQKHMEWHGMRANKTGMQRRGGWAGVVPFPVPGPSQRLTSPCLAGSHLNKPRPAYNSP